MKKWLILLLFAFPAQAHDPVADNAAAILALQELHASVSPAPPTPIATFSDCIPNGNVGSVFDGVDDYCDLGTLDIDAPFLTIAVKFKAASFGIPDARLVSKADSTATQGHLWMLSTVANSGEIRPRARLKTDGVTITLIGEDGSGLSPGVEYTLVLTYDGIEANLYLNNVIVAAAVVSGLPNVDPTRQAWIGGQPPSETLKPFDGVIFEIEIFDRGLTPPELLSLFSRV